MITAQVKPNCRNCGIPMLIVGRDGHVADVCELLEPLLGGPADEIVGHPITDFLPGYSLERLIEHVNPAASDAVVRGVAGRDLKGRDLDLGLFISPFLDPDGGMSCSILVRDIRHEVRTERLLRDELLLSDSVVRSARIGVFEFYPRTDTVKVSRVWREMMGIFGGDSDYLQSEWRRRVHPDDLERALAPVRKCLDGRARHAHSDYRVRKSEDEEWRWVRAGVTVGERDADNNPICLTGAMIDVTDMKETEHEIRRSAETLRLAFDHAPIGKAINGLDLRILRANQALADLLGYTPEELSQLSFQDIVRPEDCEQATARVRRMIAGEIGTYQVEKRFVRKDGSLIWGLMIAGVVHDSDGQPVEWVLQIVDVSEQHRLTDMKGEFIATVSHELRTPLTGILGALTLLNSMMADKLPEQAARLLYIAEENGHRLHALIDDILDFEKFSTGRAAFSITRCEIVPMLEEAILANDPIAREYGVHCSIIAYDRSLKGYCDPKKFQQVMANFLSNASKFATRDSTIRVIAIQSGDAIRVSVTNDGPGIPDDFRDSVFKPFAQAEMSSKRSRGGTGLGLSICKEIVEQSGGTIGFDSEPGGQTMFWFTVPTDQAQAAE